MQCVQFPGLACVYLFFVVHWAGGKKEVKKETGLGLTNKKDDNFGEWYSEVLFRARFLFSSLQNDSLCSVKTIRMSLRMLFDSRRSEGRSCNFTRRLSTYMSQPMCKIIRMSRPFLFEGSPL